MHNKLAILFAIAFVGLGWPGGAFGQANQAARASVIELPYPYELGSTYEVTKVDPGGTAQIVAVGPSPESDWDEAGRLPDGRRLLPAPKAKRPEPALPADDYLMLVRPPVDGSEPTLLRVEVSVAGAKEWTVRLGKGGAARVRTGDRCSMIQPQNVTEAQLRALPEVIPFTAPKETSNSRTAHVQARTLANLSKIGLALKRFEDAHDFWPPAVLVGPDGKPWHSWRVLLLPYLGHRDLFDQYDFSQPWDSPKNLRLLDRMPAVFHDPIYGEELGHFTHYAAVVGTNGVLTAFSGPGVEMKNATIWAPRAALPAGREQRAERRTNDCVDALARKNPQAEVRPLVIQRSRTQRHIRHDRCRGGLARAEDPLDHAGGHHRRAQVPAPARQARRHRRALFIWREADHSPRGTCAPRERPEHCPPRHHSAVEPLRPPDPGEQRLYRLENDPRGSLRHF